jgi:AraC family transcriptional regulator
MNPAHGWTDYHARMSRVIAHVYEHLEQPLDLNHLAQVAHLSPYHWHRVYQALHGETLAHTVRRLRLHRASAYLANTALPVTQIASRCGYPNVQSFTRAFRTLYGASPAHYRVHGSHAEFRRGQASISSQYPIEIREVPRMRLAGLAHRGSYIGVGKAFESAYALLAARQLVAPGARWMAVYLDDPTAVPESQLISQAGLSVPHDCAIEPPLIPFEVGGTPCAVLRHTGPYASMRAAYEWLYGYWLVNSGREAADLPVFEEYLNNPRETAPADLLTDIFLPLTPVAVI